MSAGKEETKREILKARARERERKREREKERKGGREAIFPRAVRIALHFTVSSLPLAQVAPKTDELAF